MKILCVLGEHNYGDPARGECYEYVNFLPALRNLGHEVVFFESFNKNYYSDFSDLNYLLLEKVSQENPDVILCVMLGYEIWLETLQLIRQGTRSLIMSWSTDDSWKYEQFSRLISPYFDLYATTYPDAVAKSRRDGFDNFVLTQWAANSDRFNEPLPASQCRYAVSFIGTNYGNRPQWIAALREHGITVDCFGYGWENGPVAAEDIPKIMRNSDISLNFGDSGIVMRGIIPGKSRQIKARVFEVPGAGGFLMTEFADGLDNFFRIDEEIAVFEGVSELAEKIKYYLKHPDVRDRLAIAGHVRTREEHSYERRFSEILTVACRAKVHRSTEGIDFDCFKRIAQKHKTGLLLRLLRTLLLAPCVLLWGRARGPRAARKVLFELSWRLAGKKTYMASGWPGRLFYKES